MNYPLASTTWDEAEYSALQRVIDSGRFTMGEQVQEFEKAFAAYVGSRYCVMVNSGSSANLLMVAALRYKSHAPIEPGAEVIVPAVSWATTYFPLYQYGLKLRFVDIDEDTLNYDLDQLAQAVTPDTKAIMVVNLLGNPNDFARLNRIIEGTGIVLLEDNCESLGATFQGKQAGTHGLMGTFSSFFSHHISTMEGGMIVTDDEELYHILLCLRAHGWTRNLPTDNHVSPKGGDPFAESFRFVLPGYNVRPLEMSGALGLEQLKKLPGFIETRRKNAQTFQEMLGEHRYLRTQSETGESSWFGFAIIIDPASGKERSEVVRVLSEAGVEVRPIVAGNFAKNEALKWIEHSISGDLKNADRLDQYGFFVGNHQYLMTDEIQFLGKTLAKAMN